MFHWKFTLPLPIAWLAGAMLLDAAAAARPNVVVIYGDDVGYGDVGAYGSEKIPTPRIDRIAAEGLRFTDAHCAASTCTPSRYSLLTGELPFRKEGTGIARGTANMIISPDQYTLADVFKNSGYQTAVVGKWHLGLDDEKIDWNGAIEPGPESLGFDHYFIIPATNDRIPTVYIGDGHVVDLDPADPITVGRRAAHLDSAPGTSYPTVRENPEAVTAYMGDAAHSQTVINGIGRIGFMKGGKSALFKDEDIADDLVGEARKFIRENKDKPFFLFFSASDIHAPRWPNQRFRGQSREGLRGDAMVSFDWSAGAIIDQLDALGLRKNTIVIVSSDNGPVYIDGGYLDGCETRGSSGSDRGHDASGIYRGGKYQIYEGGSRVPFIVSWPGKIQPGISAALISQTDLLASFAGYLGQEVPRGAARDSRNLFHALTGDDPTGAEVIVTCAFQKVAIRRGRWKYMSGPRGLYDLANDPGETRDLLESHPEKAGELAELLDKVRHKGLGGL